MLLLKCSSAIAGLTLGVSLAQATPRPQTALEEFFKITLSPAHLTLSNCGPTLNGVYEKLFQFQVGFKGVTLFQENIGASRTIAKDAFLLRLRLRDRLVSLMGRNPNVDDVRQAECLSAAKSVSRALRFVEETVSALSLDAPVKVPSQDQLTSNFEGGEPYLWVNPKHAYFNGIESLREGDVLLSRGNKSVSALISRLSDDDAQFSHAALVARDPDTKALIVLEAHIEVGSTISPIEKFVGAYDGRVLVFRHPNKKLARNAARLMYERLTDRRHDYNFHMDMKNDRELFCSQVVREAFLMASGGALALPWVPSSFQPNDPYLIDTMGITSKRTFAPGDIEWDDEFELLAEWKEIKRAWTMQIHDAVLVKMLEWIDKDHYRFHESITSKIASRVGYQLRHWIATGWILNGNMPLNMPKETLKLVTIYHQVASLLFREMTNRSEAMKELRGYPLLYPELLHELDKFRKTDEERYLTQEHALREVNGCSRFLKRAFGQAGAAPKMHPYFRGPGWSEQQDAKQ